MRIPSVASRPELQRSRFLAGLAVLAAALLLAPLPAAGQARELRQARAKLAAGQVSDAQRLAESALRANPRDPRVHLLLGSVSLAEGKLSEASKSFEFALALDSSLRSEVGRAYLDAIRRAVAASQSDRALSELEQSKRVAPGLQHEAEKILFDDAFDRFRAGDAAGAKLLDRWLARFPDYSPKGEKELFALASHFEKEGKRSAAARLYAECAHKDPEGELGKRAAEILQSRTIWVDRQVAVPCRGRLFAVLRSLKLGYDATEASISFVWVSENRSNETKRNFALLPDSKLETSAGKSLGVVTGDEGSSWIGRNLDLPTDAERRVTLTFPPIPRDEKSVSVDLTDNACGQSGRWGRYSLRFSNVSLPKLGGAVDGEARPSVVNVPVFHLHSYIVASGHCSGTLRFGPDRISYVSGPHSFELPCRDVVQVTTRMEAISDLNVFHPLNQEGLVPTLLIRGRVTTRRGKERTKSWNFLAQDGTPPVLLVSKNRCPTRH